MENPIKMDDLGVPLFFGNTHTRPWSQEKWSDIFTDAGLEQRHSGVSRVKDVKGTEVLYLRFGPVEPMKKMGIHQELVGGFNFF